ncbi:MAG: flagellar motor protein MotB [Deltaproteobacteria bacterium]|nr:flagellar motor protein MotB [Deltaproteobacteria bacterium]
MAEKLTAPRIRIKKRGGGHGHHGGAWKVAYADFVTAMMALFMVMWLIASTDAKSRKEIANYFRTGILEVGDMSMQGASQMVPAVLEQTGTPPTEEGADIENDAETIKDAIEDIGAADPELRAIAANVSVMKTPEGVLIEAIDREGGEGMLFEVASSDVKPALVTFLTRLAPVLNRVGKMVRVMGHTDARKYVSGKKSNWDLSFERASAAHKVLASHGMAEQIESVTAFGPTRLRNTENPIAAENRRLGLLVLSPGSRNREKRTLPPTLDGFPAPGDAHATPGASPPAAPSPVAPPAIAPEKPAAH